MREALRLYKVPILLGLMSVSSIGVAIVLLIKSATPQSPIQFSSDSASTSSVLGVSEITIDIEGAVNKPGVYTVPRDSRVEDAIRAAGGLTPYVDLDAMALSLNRAQKLVDGAKLYIPISGSEPTVGQETSGLVSVNSASQSDLESLPGIGPVTAKKIMDNRPYQILEELVSKKAVGQSLFDKIKSQITL